MKRPNITSTKEDYLRAMYQIRSTHDGKIRVIDIATYLHLSKSTVSERLKELSKQKYIQYQRYSDIELTTIGLKVAQKLTYKHRIIEVFLFDYLNMPKQKIHEEAHRLEHAFSDEAIEKLNELVGNPKLDPHGKPILEI